jgi:hypothetical protein
MRRATAHSGNRACAERPETRRHHRENFLADWPWWGIHTDGGGGRSAYCSANYLGVISRTPWLFGGPLHHGRYPEDPLALACSLPLRAMRDPNRGQAGQP